MRVAEAEALSVERRRALARERAGQDLVDRSNLIEGADRCICVGAASFYDPESDGWRLGRLRLADAVRDGPTLEFSDSKSRESLVLGYVHFLGARAKSRDVELKGLTQRSRAAWQVVRLRLGARRAKAE